MRQVGEKATFLYKNVKWAYADPIFAAHHRQTVTILEICSDKNYKIEASDSWIAVVYPGELV